MRYVAAYMLATLGGNENPSVEDIKKILGSVGIEVAVEQASDLISKLSGKNVESVVAEGLGKLASMPAGGAAAPVAAAVSGSAAPAAAAAKEDKKAAPKEESDEDMGFGLFD